MTVTPTLLASNLAFSPYGPNSLYTGLLPQIGGVPTTGLTGSGLSNYASFVGRNLPTTGQVAAVPGGGLFSQGSGGLWYPNSPAPAVHTARAGGSIFSTPPSAWPKTLPSTNPFGAGTPALGAGPAPAGPFTGAPTPLRPIPMGSAGGAAAPSAAASGGGAPLSNVGTVNPNPMPTLNYGGRAAQAGNWLQRSGFNPAHASRGLMSRAGLIGGGLMLGSTAAGLGDKTAPANAASAGGIGAGLGLGAAGVTSLSAGGAAAAGLGGGLAAQGIVEGLERMPGPVGDFYEGKSLSNAWNNLFGGGGGGADYEIALDQGGTWKVEIPDDDKAQHATAQARVLSEAGVVDWEDGDAAEMNRRMHTYATMNGTTVNDMSDEEARALGTQVTQEMLLEKEAVVEQEELFARQLMVQEAFAKLTAPATGRMRQRALESGDENWAMMADAYDAQIGIAPAALAQQQATETNASIANQLQQTAIQQQLQGYMDPMGMMGGNPLSELATAI